MSSPSIFIAIPNTNKVVTYTASFLFHLANTYPGHLGLFTPMEIPHDNNRNYIVQEFLKKDGSDGQPLMEWLLMFDSDITPPRTILDMVKNGKNVCSGLICAQKYGVRKPIALTWIEGADLDKYNIVTREGSTEPVKQKRPGYYYLGHKDNELQRVDATGTGCLMIHRSVLERMREAMKSWPPEQQGWFRFHYDHEGRVIKGEDIDFCEKAKALGEEIWFDARQVCLHRTDVIV